MRRTDREITDRSEMLRIVQSCDCCRLGFNEPGGAYILPLNFVAEDVDGQLTLFFHSATAGKKIDLVQAQPQVGFEMDTAHALLSADTACGHSYLYESVMGKGDISLLTRGEEKRAALMKIMEKYTGKADWDIPDAALASVAILRLTVTEWSCKAH